MSIRTTARLTVAVALAAHVAHASLLGPPPVVNPARYRSPSGDYGLNVDPSHRYGEGSGTYRLTHRGQEIWAGERPFTLLQAAVTDEGVVTGYSYDGGVGYLNHEGS